MASQDLVIETLVELADNLVDDFDVVEMLTTLSSRCVDAFGVSDAGILLASPGDGRLRVVASSSPAMRELELYELQAEEGPCYDTVRTGTPILNAVLRSSTERWPAFAPAAVAGGYESASALPMRLRHTTIGCLNLFRSVADPIPQDDLAAVRAFADMATITILQHRATTDAQEVNRQLEGALGSRVVIEQAKGMFAERAGIEVDQAFDRLRDHARRTNVRLSDLARDFLDGRVPMQAFGAKTRRT